MFFRIKAATSTHKICYFTAYILDWLTCRFMYWKNGTAFVPALKNQQH